MKIEKYPLTEERTLTYAVRSTFICVPCAPIPSHKQKSCKPNTSSNSRIIILSFGKNLTFIIQKYFLPCTVFSSKINVNTPFFMDR